MADIEEKKEQERNEEQPEEGKKKKKLKMFIVLPLVLILAGGGYFFYAKKLSSKEATKDVKKVEKERMGPILSLEPFLFNIEGTVSQYAKISVGIELRDEKVMEETKKMVPAIRDKILSFLSSKPANVLIDVEKREAMKKELCSHLKPLFSDETYIKNVYITDIIIQ